MFGEQTSIGEGRRERKARATRHALLDAGLSAFMRSPLAMVSVQDITDAADVAKGVFYLHFRSRDEFLLALWAQVQDDFLQCARERIVKARSLRARLAAIIDAYAHMAAERPREVVIWLRMASQIADEIGVPGALTALRERYFEQLAELVRGAKPFAGDEDVAQTLDALCWALIWQAVQLRQSAPTAETLAKRVVPALKGLL